MTKYEKKVMLGLLAEILSLTEAEAERMDRLEEYSKVFGAEFRELSPQLKAKIAESGGKYAAEALRTVEAYFAKDGDGERCADEDRPCRVVIRFGSRSQDGPKITQDEYPDIEAMSPDTLRDFYEELHAQLDDLYDAEPEDETSEEYDEWEDGIDDLENLIDDVIDRLEELGYDI